MIIEKLGTAFAAKDKITGRPLRGLVLGRTVADICIDLLLLAPESLSLP
jgi:hypothetical protein